MLRVILYISQTLNFNAKHCSNELSWLYMKGLLNFNIDVLIRYCRVINCLKTQWYSAISTILPQESGGPLAIVDRAKSLGVRWAFPCVCRSAGGEKSKDDPTSPESGPSFSSSSLLPKIPVAAETWKASWYLSSEMRVSWRIRKLWPSV